MYKSQGREAHGLSPRGELENMIQPFYRNPEHNNWAKRTFPPLRSVRLSSPYQPSIPPNKASQLLAQQGTMKYKYGQRNLQVVQIHPKHRSAAISQLVIPFIQNHSTAFVCGNSHHQKQHLRNALLIRFLHDCSLLYFCYFRR